MNNWRFADYHSLSSQEKSSFSMGPFGSKITKENYVPDGVPLIRGNNLAHGIFHDDDFVFISDKKADDILPANVSPGDIIFTHRGTIGQVTMVPRSPKHYRYAIGSSQVKTRLDSSIALPEFYYYWFRSPKGQSAILANTSTVGVPGIATPLTSIKKLMVPVPPLADQQAIATVLGALDEKITANELLSANIDSLIQCLYKKAISTSPPKDIPLFDAVEITFGAPFSSSEFNTQNEGRPLIRIRDLKTFTPQVWTTQKHEKEKLIKPGDTVAGMDAEFRPTFWTGEGALLNQRVMHVASKVGGGSPFCREALRGPFAEVEGYKTGTTVAHLNKSDLKTLIVKAPTHQALTEFENVTSPLHSRFVETDIESRKLAELRDTLLPQLMSGKLRVKDAEKIVEDNV